MPENSSRVLPDWDNLYKNQEVKTMPWYNERLDIDLEEELERRKIATGRILDLGTGPATQAIELSKRGLKVTGSDISSSAIQRARKIYGRDKNVEFVIDNVLDSKFDNNRFEYVFDRGCFHVMPIEKRSAYVGEIIRILNDQGILFLKYFSIKEPREEGPYKISEGEIKRLFEHDFSIESIKHTVYQGTLDPLPKALFVVMKKR